LFNETPAKGWHDCRYTTGLHCLDCLGLFLNIFIANRAFPHKLFIPLMPCFFLK